MFSRNRSRFVERITAPIVVEESSALCTSDVWKNMQCGIAPSVMSSVTYTSDNGFSKGDMLAFADDIADISQVIPNSNCADLDKAVQVMEEPQVAEQNNQPLNTK